MRRHLICDETDRLDPQDNQILKNRIRALAEAPGPHVGDFVRFADGVERRISHLWTEMEEVGLEDMAQTSDNGSYYIGNGYVSMSGSLFPGTPLAKLNITGEVRLAPVWFFHHDYKTADNGVDVKIPFHVYETTEEAPQ